MVAVICLCSAPNPSGADTPAPAPEFAVQSIFQENLARKFAKHCGGLAFDHAGYDRHVRARIAQFSDRGVHSRNIFKNFAPIQPHRYQRHIDQFNAGYGLHEGSTLAAFCAAADTEARNRTPIGQMLKRVAGAGE